MYLNAILLGFIGFVGGISTAAGLFALLISLSVITRIIAKVKDARHVIRYEDCYDLGGNYRMYYFGLSHIRITGRCMGDIFVWNLCRNICRMSGCGISRNY